MTDRSILVRDAMIVLAVRGKTEAAIEAVVESDRNAALEGIVEALGIGRAAEWNLITAINCFTSDELRAAGVENAVVERRRLREELAAARQSQPVADEYATYEDTEPASRPSLAELLAKDDDESRFLVLANARTLASDADSLTQDESEKLRQLLEENWPAVPVSETISRTNRHSWSVEHGTSAWLEYGSVLKPDLTPKRWAELSACGILFQPQTEWLREAFVDGAIDELRRLELGPGLSQAMQSLDCIPVPPPCDLVAQAAREDARDDDGYEIRRLAEIAVANGCSEAIGIMEQTAGGRNATLPHLAAAGDEQAQMESLTAMRDSLVSGDLPSEYLIGWLGTPVSDSVLPTAFTCLEAAYDLDRQRDGHTGWMRASLVNGLLRTIAASSLPTVVQLFDELLAKDQKYRFLRLERDAAARDLCDSRGIALAADALRAVGFAD